MYSGSFTQAVRDKFHGIVLRAQREFVNSRIEHRLVAARDLEDSPDAPTEAASSDLPNGVVKVEGEVVTTQEEVDGYHIVRAIVASVLAPNRVVMRDTKSYCGVLVDDTLATSAPHVWAAGDCAEIRRPEGARNLMQQVWYTGRLQAEVAAANICGDEAPYDPGIWFNSAKFFDLEWQTYGMVPSRPGEGQRSLYWEAPDQRTCMRLVANGDGTLHSMHAFGIRYRHRVCEAWIRDRLPISEVLDRLPEANFDPEFYKRHERQIAAAMRSQL